MKTISFSNQQVEFLIEQYESELVLAKEYVDQIVEILNKLGVNTKASKENTVEKEPRQYKKRGRKPVVKVAEPKIPAKRGRKPKVALPTLIEAAPVPAPKPEKNAKITKKVKVAKKAIKKPAIVKKESAKGAAAIKPISNPEPSPAPKKEVKKVAKKKSAPKKKVVAKKAAKKQAPVAETSPVVETLTTPAEAPKE